VNNLHREGASISDAARSQSEDEARLTRQAVDDVDRRTEDSDWQPAKDAATQNPFAYEVHPGEDPSISYRSHDAELYLHESVFLLTPTAESSVPLNAG
jgi:uncharacterized linocin/CFP29 family protein